MTERPSRQVEWTDDEREERWMEAAAEEDPEPTVEDDLDLAIALLHNRPDGDLRDDAYARASMAWTDQFDLLMMRHKRRKGLAANGHHEGCDHTGNPGVCHVLPDPMGLRAAAHNDGSHAHG